MQQNWHPAYGNSLLLTESANYARSATGCHYVQFEFDTGQPQEWQQPHQATGSAAYFPRAVTSNETDFHLIVNYTNFLDRPTWEGDEVRQSIAASEEDDIVSVTPPPLHYLEAYFLKSPLVCYGFGAFDSVLGPPSTRS